MLLSKLIFSTPALRAPWTNSKLHVYLFSFHLSPNETFAYTWVIPWYFIPRVHHLAKAVTSSKCLRGFWWPPWQSLSNMFLPQINFYLRMHYSIHFTYLHQNVKAFITNKISLISEGFSAFFFSAFNMAELFLRNYFSAFQHGGKMCFCVRLCITS